MTEGRSERTRAESGFPREVVAIGGGTGLPSVLRGFRDLVARGDLSGLTAIVTMSDDGGSSGRLRRSRGVLPPGDVRNCLVALSEDEDLMAGLFQHRYGGDKELGGHNLGNLILAALAEQTGSFLKAVEVSSRVLRTSGRILPVTLEDVTLEARCADGSHVSGESAIDGCGKRVDRIRMLPESARPTPGVVEAIHGADLVVLGPGSLYTSVVSNLVLEPVARALRETSAVRVLVGNLVTDRTDPRGCDLQAHIATIESHAGGRVLDVLLMHEGKIEAQVLSRYRIEGASPLELHEEHVSGVRVIRRNLLAAGRKLRHGPSATAGALVDAWRALHTSPAAAG